MRILNPKSGSDSKLFTKRESGTFLSGQAGAPNSAENKSGAAQAELKRLNEVEPSKVNTSNGSYDSVCENNGTSLADRPQGSLSLSPTKEEEQKKEYDNIYNKGIHLLSMREHSVKEMFDKLSRKCDRTDLIDAIIEELITRKYLSNDRFTESYVRSRKDKGFGPIKIRSELSNKGVCSTMIDDYLKSASGIWFDEASNQYHKKYGDELISDYNVWTKRARFLQGRGFAMDHIYSAIGSPESE